MRVLVDMSLSIIHHGHIRLIRRASDLGEVIIGLTTDEEIKSHKGFLPKLTYSQREEIAMGLKHVTDVIASPWIIDNFFMDVHKLDLLVHGDDNRNLVDVNRTIIFPRTPNISSTMLRGTKLS